MSDALPRPAADECPPLRPLRYRDVIDAFPFYRARRPGRGVPSPPGRGVLLDGALLQTEIDGGVRNHATDAVEQQDGAIEAVLPPGLTVAIILDGHVSAELDGLRLAVSGRGEPVGKLWSFSDPTRPVRHMRRGRRVRKVQVAAPHAWLRAVVEPLPEAGRALLERLDGPPAIADWRPSGAAVRYAEDALGRGPAVEALGPLEMRICALGIVHDALRGLVAGGPAVPAAGASCDVARSRAVRAWVDARLDRPLTLEGVGRATGMSVSTMQRVFKRRYGVTVGAHLRAARLDAARAALLDGTLSIQQAARRAGYASAANFATAFRRRFGYPPSRRRA